MTSITGSTPALPCATWVAQGKSITFTVLASLTVNLGFEMIKYLHLGAIVKIKYCMVVSCN